MIRTVFVSSVYMPEHARPVFVELDYQDEEWAQAAKRGIFHALHRLGLEILKQEARARREMGRYDDTQVFGM